MVSYKVRCKISQPMIKPASLFLPLAALGIASCSSGNIAAKCEKYKAEMASHAQANPALSGNFDTDAAISWSEKNKEIVKGFLQAAGVEYKEGDSMEDMQANLSGIMEASTKCKEAGVDMMKN